MRASLSLALVGIISALVTSCGDSPTAPARCIDHTTSSSYLSLDSITGTITAISRVQGSRATFEYQILQLDATGSQLASSYSVDSNTAVFVRVGTSPPTASSLCSLAVGDEVQVSSGFGDFPDLIAAVRPEVLLPPPLGQIVIQR